MLASQVRPGYTIDGSTVRGVGFSDGAVLIKCGTWVMTGAARFRIHAGVSNKPRTVRVNSLSRNHALHVRDKWSAIVRVTRNRRHVVVDTASGDRVMLPRHARIDIIDL